MHKIYICTRYMVVEKLELRKSNDILNGKGMCEVLLIMLIYFLCKSWNNIQCADHIFFCKTWNTSIFDADQASGGVMHARQLFLFVIIIV